MCEDDDKEEEEKQVTRLFTNTAFQCRLKSRLDGDRLCLRLSCR